MQDRVGSALRIGVRTPGQREPHPFIEPHGLPVLLVDIHTITAKFPDSIVNQAPPDSTAPALRMNEKHLDISVTRAQESRYKSRIISCRRQSYSREITI